MVFGGWCDGEGPRAAAQVYNPRANAWTLWTEAGPQAQGPAHDWLELANQQAAAAAAAAIQKNSQDHQSQDQQQSQQQKPPQQPPPNSANDPGGTHTENGVTSISTRDGPNQSSALDVANAIISYRASMQPDGPETDILDKIDAQLLESSGSLIGEIPRRVYAGCVLIGTRVYLVGGFDGTNALKSTLCYDFEIDSGW